ncbi:alkyl hydroperoxide reductase [Cellulophaga geojensis KL-A]|uniref:Alkyl hydroperoxide reductase n=1 Tax=Cellulophaga geojensis KL-A TaxID=1328323 RepID=A0ABP3B593_9FLAO|nr:alkyl hydroperoxide reductase [Cellulophaga geojensis KL-A]
MNTEHTNLQDALSAKQAAWESNASKEQKRNDN